MPKHDSCHDAVADALEREGWQVLSDQRRKRERRAIFIDLLASRDNRTTFIEVKCFSGEAFADEQYTAIGQYLTYRTFLRLEGLNQSLYLAVPARIYEESFDDVMLETLKEHHIWLLIFDETRQRNLQWIAW